MIKTRLVRNLDGTYGVKVRVYWFFWKTFAIRDDSDCWISPTFYTYKVFSGTAMEAISHMIKIENKL